MSLVELQNQFFAAVFNNAVAENIFKGPAELLTQRLGIYRDSMSGMRYAALSKTFNCCKKIVGDDYWQQLLDEFVSLTPSQNVDITLSGEAFTAFITTHPVLTHVPYLADLARLEWAWQQCFHHGIIFKPQQTLAQALEQQGEQLRLLLAPGVQLLESIYPLDALWLLCQQANQEALVLEDLNIKRYFILYREHDRITIKQVLKPQWQISQLLLAQEQSIIDLCTEHQQRYHTSLNTEALQEWVENGIINWRP